MLQRAASNAYSWWWASHVRTKQSKWLEQSLQDMEEKVGSVLRLIQEDGDSFAKRAEMYYKKRPELINFVEESYRAYRSLAERYDLLSKELQNANTTIASVFPEQVQFAMEEEDDFSSPRVQKTNNASQKLANNVPKVPKFPSRDLKGLFTSASKKLQVKKSSKVSNTVKPAPKSGLSKSEALEEIDKVQKEILALQTVKEFVRSSYESGLTKYWEIDYQITELQEKVCGLQDEFRVGGKVIDDDEARTLMAEAALKSCEEALAQLQEKQEKSSKEARAEFKRVGDTRERLKSLKHKFLPEEKANDKDESVKTSGNPECLNPETGDLTQERLEMERFKEEIKEHFKVGCKESLSVTELAEKIDELVSKVIDLETAASSQTALVDQSKTETDNLQLQIKALEDDKAILSDGTNTLTERLREMEEKLNGIQDRNQNFEDENNNLQICFTEARCSLRHLAEKLQSAKPDEEVEHMESLKEESYVKVKTSEELGNQENTHSPTHGSKNTRELKEVVGDDASKKVLSISVTNQAEKAEEKVTISEKHEDPKIPDNVANTEAQEVGTEKEDESNWQLMLLNGLEDKEKILLKEYTSILRNYKDLKKKLSDVENENRESLFETTVQLKELRSAIAKRDEEIQSLRHKLKLLQEKVGENKDFKEEKVGENKDFKEDSRSIPNLIDDQNNKPEVIEDSRGNGGIEEDFELILIDQPHPVSPIEEKLRLNIDALLDENLDFWLRFSTSFHQVQKFKTGFQDLEAEISKLKEKEKSNKEGSSRARANTKSDLKPIYAHLREIQTELTLWLEQSALLKVELQRRFSSLCKIQEEITEALKAGAEEEEMRFTSYEATKFQGEVLNMKQENKKVSDELQMGLDHVTSLQLEIEKTLEKLNEDFGFSGSKGNNPSELRHSTSRSRVPLRSFIFGTKPKKRNSIFACMHHRKYNLRTEVPM